MAVQATQQSKIFHMAGILEQTSNGKRIEEKKIERK